MKCARALAVLAAAIIGGVGLWEVEAGARSNETVRLSLGDRVELDRANVGCRVTRLAGHGKQVFIDCRRAGRPLRGTYGMYMGEARVLVVRFLDPHTARVVFSARQEGTAKSCD